MPLKHHFHWWDIEGRIEKLQRVLSGEHLCMAAVYSCYAVRPGYYSDLRSQVRNCNFNPARRFTVARKKMSNIRWHAPLAKVYAYMAQAEVLEIGSTRLNSSHLGISY